MNKNESARNYIQFNYCDSLQNRESCRDELYKTSRQRWCDELDVGDTCLSICTEGTTTWNTIVADLSVGSTQSSESSSSRIPVNEYTYLHKFSTNNKSIKSQQFKKRESLKKKEITQCMLTSLDQAPTHRPHTHSLDSSTFTEAQRTQPSPFDHRSQGHTSYMDRQDSTSLWLY